MAPKQAQKTYTKGDLPATLEFNGEVNVTIQVNEGIVKVTGITNKNKTITWDSSQKPSKHVMSSVTKIIVEASKNQNTISVTINYPQGKAKTPSQSGTPRTTTTTIPYTMNAGGWGSKPAGTAPRRQARARSTSQAAHIAHMPLFLTRTRRIQLQKQSYTIVFNEDRGARAECNLLEGEGVVTVYRIEGEHKSPDGYSRYLSPDPDGSSISIESVPTIGVWAVELLGNGKFKVKLPDQEYIKGKRIRKIDRKADYEDIVNTAKPVK